MSRPYVLASAFYLLYFGAFGALQPFLNVYYQSRGMSNQNIGLLAALPTLVTILASPLWSAVADARRMHRSILIMAVAGTMLPVFLLGQATTFGALALFVGVAIFFLSPIIPLADSAILAMLPNPEGYGRLRLWGAVGWGIAAWASGALIQSSGLGTAFYTYLVIMALNIYVVARLPVTSPEKSEVSYFADLRHLLSDRLWLGFLLVVFLGGICHAIINNYLVLYLKELGAAESFLGLIIAVSAFTEIPIFFLSPWLLRKFKPRGVLIGATIALTLRSLIFSLIADPTWALAGQLLHGPSFAAMLAAGVIYAREIAPKRLAATAQSMLGTTTFGISGVAGALLGAQLYDSIGPALMFRVAAVFGLVAVLIFWLMGRFSARKTVAVVALEQ